MADVGSAFVTLMPSMRGFTSQINAEFNGINLGSQGTRIGSEFGDGVNSGFSKASTGATGFSGKMAALGGAVAGVASNIAGNLIDSVVGLAGEMVSAADGAQKFASTLSFAGIDDSTIKQLTASTQAYADQTVYDLNDIRNVTAQLAANGVNDYATLAEAAGNLNAVAGGNADTFKSVGMVLTQTAGSGKLMTENWNQLTDAIPGASGALQDAMRNAGAFEGNFREAMENGEISSDEFFAAVQQLGMQDVAVEAATSTSTIEGAMGNLQASVVGVGAGLIDAFKPAITGSISGIAEAVTWLGNNLNTIAPYAAIAAGAVGSLAAASVIGQMGGLSAAVRSVSGAVTKMGASLLAIPGVQVIAIIAAVAAALVGLYQTNEQFRNAVNAAFAQIAAAVMPVLQQLRALFKQLASALTPVVNAILSMLVPAITFLATTVAQFVANVVSVVMPVIQQILTAIQTAMPAIQGAITTALGVIQAIWNAVWPAIQAVVTTVFSLIQNHINTAMGVIQGVISAVTGIISGDWSAVWNGIEQIASSIWDGIKSLVSTAVNAVESVISGALGIIQGIWSSAWNSVKSLFSSIWDGIKSAASAGIDAVVSTVTGIKDRIVGFFSGAGQWLVDSGRAILDGLASGISAGFDAVTGVVEDGLSFIRGLFPFSPAKRGPFSGHGYTTFSGKALMGDFAESIRSQAGKVAAATESVLGVAQRGLSAQLTTTQNVSAAQPRAEEPRTREVTMNFYGKTDSPDEIARMMRLNERYGFAGSY